MNPNEKIVKLEWTLLGSDKNIWDKNEPLQAPGKNLEKQMNTFRSQEKIMKQEWTPPGYSNKSWYKNEPFQVWGLNSEAPMNPSGSQE